MNSRAGLIEPEEVIPQSCLDKAPICRTAAQPDRSGIFCRHMKYWTTYLADYIEEENGNDGTIAKALETCLWNWSRLWFDR